jgi:hypothetical protein
MNREETFQKSIEFEFESHTDSKCSKVQKTYSQQFQKSTEYQHFRRIIFWLCHVDDVNGSVGINAELQSKNRGFESRKSKFFFLRIRVLLVVMRYWQPRRIVPLSYTLMILVLKIALHPNKSFSKFISGKWYSSTGDDW